MQYLCICISVFVHWKLGNIIFDILEPKICRTQFSRGPICLEPTELYVWLELKMTQKYSGCIK